MVSSHDAPHPTIYRGRLGTVNHEPTTRAFRRCVPVANAILGPVTKKDYSGQDAIPQTGGVIIAPNHICSLDPLVIGHYLVYSGRWPHFVARSNLFERPALGPLLRSLEQIPVLRGSARASDSLGAAEQMLLSGGAVIVYPEGTFTYDPQEWPMAGHTGVARLALRTHVPVIPVGQWGANFIIPPRRKRPPRLIGRTTVSVHAGPPVALDDLYERGESDRLAVHEATVRVMDAITAQAGIARGKQPPIGRWHPGKKRRIDPDHAVL